MKNFVPDFTDEELEADGLFGGGFVALLRSDADQLEEAAFSILRRWFDRREIGAYSVFVAPRTPVLQLQSKSKTILAIGDIFDNDGDLTPDARLEAIATAKDLPRAIAQSDLGGRHAVLIISGDRLHVFNDPMGSRSVHFFAKTFHAVSSHALLLAKLFNTDVAPDVARYVKTPQYNTRTVKYLPGNRTLFEDINRLLPNHLYSLPRQKMKRFWPHEPRVESTEDALHARFDAALNALRRHVAGKYMPVIGMTGGADTRVVLSNLHVNQQPFVGMTWLDINFSNEERPPIKQICELTGQPYYGVLKKKSSENEAYKRQGALNSGALPSTGLRGGLMAQIAEKMLQDAISLPPVFIIGYGGEIIRGFYKKTVREENLDVGPEAMLSMFGAATKKAGADKKVSQFVLRAFRRFYKDGSFQKDALMGYDAHDLFYWEHRMGMWGTLTLETIDPAMHCLVGMNSRRLYEAALSQPNAARMSTEMLHRYIKSRSPEMGAIPIV